MTTRAIKKLTKKDELLELNKKPDEKTDSSDEEANEQLVNVGKNKFNLVKSIFVILYFLKLEKI